MIVNLLGKNKFSYVTEEYCQSVWLSKLNIQFMAEFTLFEFIFFSPNSIFMTLYEANRHHLKIIAIISSERLFLFKMWVSVCPNPGLIILQEIVGKEHNDKYLRSLWKENNVLKI